MDPVLWRQSGYERLDPHPAGRVGDTRNAVTVSLPGRES